MVQLTPVLPQQLEVIEEPDHWQKEGKPPPLYAKGMLNPPILHVAGMKLSVSVNTGTAAAWGPLQPTQGG